MPEAVEDQIADAIVSLLSGAPGGTFSQAIAGFTKSYAPQADAAVGDLTTRNVIVTPGEQEWTVLTRGRRCQVDYDMLIQYGLQLSGIGSAVVRAETKLLQEIALYLLRNGLSGRTETAQPKFVISYDADRLKQSGTYVGGITLTYRGSQ